MLADTGTFFSVDLYDGEWALEHGVLEGWPAETMRKLDESQVGAEDVLRRAIARGVRIVFGTDSGVYPHGLNARNFAWYTRCGMSPTRRDPDRDEGRRRGDGLVGSGRLAGRRAGSPIVVAVAGDPLDDLTELERPMAVLKGGRAGVRWRRRRPGVTGDGRAARRRRAAHRLRARRLGRRGDAPGRRVAGAWRDAVPGRRLRQLPRDGRWDRLRPDVPDGGPARPVGGGASGRRPAGAAGRSGHGRHIHAARAARSRSRGATWTSPSWAADRPDARRPRPRSRSGKTVSWCWMPARGTRSWRSTRGRCSSCARGPGCSTSTPTRSWSRPGRPRSIRSCRGAACVAC